MNKQQAMSLLALIADLYAVVNQPEETVQEVPQSPVKEK